MEKKYELLTESTIVRDSKSLYRIRSLRTIHDANGRLIIRKGDLGGYVESEENLSHEGCCWIDHNSCAMDNARVEGNAMVLHNSFVCGNAFVGDNAFVLDHASVRCNGKLYGNAMMNGISVVFGNAEVFENSVLRDIATVGGNAKVYGSTRLIDRVQILDNADISVPSNCFIAGMVYGNAKIHITDNKKSLNIPHHASICGDATINSFEDFVYIDGLDSLTPASFFRCKDDQICVTYGSFFGTTKKFREYIKNSESEEKVDTKLAFVDLVETYLKIK